MATAVLGAPLLLGGVASGAEATVTFSATLPVRATNWNQNVSLPRFNAALGELRAVDLTIDARMDASLRIENLAPSPATLATRVSATVAVARPGPTGTTISNDWRRESTDAGSAANTPLDPSAIKNPRRS